MSYQLSRKQKLTEKVYLKKNKKFFFIKEVWLDLSLSTSQVFLCYGDG